MVRRKTIAACLAVCSLLSAGFAVPAGKGRDYYEARKEIVWEVPTEEKVIALTFDDGPDPVHTPRILDLLREYEARATFFVVGKRVEQYPELVVREMAEGHEIANHTYSHRFFTRNDSASEMAGEIRKAEEIIRKVTGHTPRLFRPPGGYYSEQLVRVSNASRYLVVLWSWHQDTKDWSKPGVRKIVGKVLNNARNGDIVLFHDFVRGKSQTTTALEQILPELKRRGYRFVTVSELLHYGWQSEPVKKWTGQDPYFSPTGPRESWPSPD